MSTIESLKRLEEKEPVDVLKRSDWLHDDHIQAGDYSGEGCYHFYQEAQQIKEEYAEVRKAVADLIAERDALREELIDTEQDQSDTEDALQLAHKQIDALVRELASAVANVAAEREACAALADELGYGPYELGGGEVGRAIRARGAK